MVSLSAVSAKTISLHYATHIGAGSAEADDFTPVSGMLSFAPGTTVHQLTVAIMADADTEEEQFTLRFSDLSNALFPTGAAGVSPDGSRYDYPAVILERTALRLSTAGGATSVAEGATIQFVVTASSAVAEPVTIPVTVALTAANQGNGNSAFAFQGSPPESVQLVAGARTATFAVGIADNNVDQADGSLRVRLGAPSGPGAERYTVPPATATLALTITDNDAPPGLTVTGGRGNESTGELVFVAQPEYRRQPKRLAVQLRHPCIGTGSAEADDFRPVSGDVNLRCPELLCASSRSRLSPMLIMRKSNSPCVSADLSNALFPTGAAGVSPDGSRYDYPAVILERTALRLSTVGGATSVAEGATIQFVVTASSAVAEPVTVPVAVALNGANQGDGNSAFAFQGSPPESVQLVAGARTATFAVGIADNNVDQADGSLRVRLGEPSGPGAERYTVPSGDRHS